MSKYKVGDKLVFDGKEINIKIQIGLKVNDIVEFIGYHHLGMLLKNDHGREFGIMSGQKKHFKRVSPHV